MPTNIHERARGPWPRFVRLLATIRWEAQFKLAKCCMRASITISDLGVFLAEPVLARSKALNEAGARFRENAPADSSRCRHSSSASRFSAGAAGFLNFNQSGALPER